MTNVLVVSQATSILYGDVIPLILLYTTCYMLNLRITDNVQLSSLFLVGNPNGRWNHISTMRNVQSVKWTIKVLQISQSKESMFKVGCLVVVDNKMIFLEGLVKEVMQSQTNVARSCNLKQMWCANSLYKGRF